jgi:hypothetical protein
LTIPVVCFSRAAGAWVVYDRPGRRDAIIRADKTFGTSFDPIERMSIKGCLPAPWSRRDGAYATRQQAEQACHLMDV